MRELLNRDLKLGTKSIMKKKAIRMSPQAAEEWEQLRAVPIDGRAKMANMRSFISRT